MEAQKPNQVSAEDVLRGLMAALAKRGDSSLVATQPELHKAFYRVLEEVRALKKAGKLEVDLLEVDFDPLYGLSGWLDRALTTAQRDLLISFPNPSYDHIEIRYRPDEATRVLNRIGNADVFAELAATFNAALGTGA